LLKNPKLGLVLALVCAGSMWFYVSRILVPYQRADSVAHERPRGNLSDLYPRWLGSRELLLHHRNPYSREVTREIQVGYYGRELDASRPGDPRDQQGFAYPVYVAFLLAPSVGFPFERVMIAFFWLLVVVSALSVPLWFRAIGWRAPPILLVTAIVLTLGSFPSLQALKLQQLTLLVAGLLSGGMALLVGGQLFAAGAMLAVASIKPQLVVPITAFLLLWALSGWRRRQRFVWGFVSTMALLFAGSEVLLPGWFGNFLMALRDYRNYAGRMSMLDVLLTQRWGRILTLLIVAAVAAICWRFRERPAGSRAFSLVTALVLAVTVIIIPMFAPYNFILLLPALLVLVENWRVLWARGLISRAGFLLGVIAVAWPWVTAIGLGIASLILAPQTVERWWWLPLYTCAKIPMPIVCLIPLSMLLIAMWQEHETRVLEAAPQAGMVA
jgi:glycosyl transferase family 87